MGWENVVGTEVGSMSEGEKGHVIDGSVWRAVKARWEADLHRS